MSNLRIMDSSLSDEATLADGNSNISASLPVTNLQNPLREYATRTINTNDMIVLVDFSASTIISGIHLGRCNFSNDVTWRIRCYGSAGQTGTLVYDSGTLNFISLLGWGEFEWGGDPWGASSMDGWPDKFATHWFTAISCRSMSITISDSGNTDGYLEAGRLFIGRYFSPEKNCDWGPALKWIDTSKQFRTAGGSIRTENKFLYRQLDFNLSWLNKNEAERLLNMQRKNGLRNDYFISLYPEETGQYKLHHDFIAKAATLNPVAQQSLNISNTTLSFVEA